MVHAQIILRSGGQVLFHKGIAHIHGCKPVYNGKCGNPDDHSHKAHESAKQQDGKQHPEAGKPRGIPQDFRSQDVAVKLLEHQDEDKEIQAFHRAHQQYEKCAGHGSDKGAEKGDHVGHSDNHAHQKHIGHF